MRIYICALFVVLLSNFSFGQSETTQKFYKVSLVPFSVESSDVKPRTLSDDEIFHITELRDENKIVVIDLDLYTRVTIYPKNHLKIKTEEE